MRFLRPIAKSSLQHLPAALLLLSLGWMQAGELPPGTIAGTVRDSPGTALAGAKVTLLGEGGALVAATVTSTTGAYAFEGIKPGKYQLRVELKGFRAAVPLAIDLTVQHSAKVDLALRLSPPDPSKPGVDASAMGQMSDTGGYSESSSLQADEVMSSVDPAGYSAPGDAATSARLLGGAASLRQDRAAGEPAGSTPMAPGEQNLFDRGTELLSRHNVAAALGVFKSGIEQYPKSTNLWIGQGIALYLRGDSDAAVRSLVQATDLNPTAYRPYLFLADAANASQKESASAAERLKRFAELYPQDARAVFHYALSLRRGSQEGRSQGGAEVEALLKKAIALDPKFSDAHLELGNCYAGQDNYPDAIEQYRQTIALDPESTAAHYKLAQALARTGHKEEAEQEIQGLRAASSTGRVGTRGWPEQGRATP